MIMRGTTPRSLSGAGLLAVLGLGAVLLPLTWAQTERPRDASPDKPETQQAVPPKVATSAVGVEGTGAQVTVSQASATVRGSAQAGEAQVAQRATTSSEPPRTGVAVAASAEEIEKARDEVELLEVQLAVKRAQYGAAEIGLQTAEERFRRFSELSKKGAVGQQELEEARLALQSEKAQLMVKKAEVMEPEVRLKQARRRLARLQGQPQEVDTRRGEKSPYPPANRAVAGGDPQIAELKRMLAEALNENKKLRLALEARSEGEARQAAVLRREMEQLLKEGKVGEANILKRKLGQPPEAANVEKYQAMFQELLKEGRVEEAKMLKEKLAAAQAAPARDKEQARLEELERKLNALIVAVEDLRRELRAQPAKDKEKH